MKNGKRMIIATFLILPLILVLFSACNTTDSKSAAAVSAALSLAEKYTGAWIDKDPDALASLLSDDVIGFDAQEAGWSYNRQEAEGMLRNPVFWAQFQVNKGTIFSSPDGQFVAISTTMDFYGADPKRVPNAHIIALKDNQVVFTYDYYGGALSKTESLPVFEANTVEPGSAKAQKLIQQAIKTVQKWQKSFNDRDVKDYLSCFAGEAKQVDLVNPDWRVLTKTELAKDVSSRFLRSSFTAKLTASDSSPLTNGFFVSADGHYAVAQGTYEDEGVSPRPWVVFLELDTGKIINQYNYLIVELSLLQQ